MRRRGYTLTEILVVIGIMVLVLGMATASFNMLTGKGSEQATENQLAATFARARNIALAESKPTGVVVAYDPADDRATAWIIQRPTIPDWFDGRAYAVADYVTFNGQDWICQTAHTSSLANAPGTATWKAIASPIDPTDADAIRLPRGISVQLLHSEPSLTAPQRDSYLSTGLIVFDADGRLDVSGQHFISRHRGIGQKIGLAQDLTVIPSLGLSICKKEGVATMGDWLYRTELPNNAPATWADELTEEDWIRQSDNPPLAINRYTGTFASNSRR
jgi:prepilin-type N-terminal cleavage/methylation domain-containing protein